MAALAVCILAAPVGAMDRPDLIDHYAASHTDDRNGDFVSCDVEETALLAAHGNAGSDSGDYRIRWMIYEPDKAVRSGGDFHLGQANHLGISIQARYPWTGEFLDMIMAPVPGCKAAVKMKGPRVLWRVKCKDDFEDVVKFIGLDAVWADFLSDELNILPDRRVRVSGKHTE
jgi:hypothetical protein